MRIRRNKLGGGRAIPMIVLEKEDFFELIPVLVRRVHRHVRQLEMLGYLDPKNYGSDDGADVTEDDVSPSGRRRNFWSRFMYGYLRTSQWIAGTIWMTMPDFIISSPGGYRSYLLDVCFEVRQWAKLGLRFLPLPGDIIPTDSLETHLRGVKSRVRSWGDRGTELYGKLKFVQAVINREREGSSSESKVTREDAERIALEIRSTSEPLFLAARDIAERHGIVQNTLEKRLERWRASSHQGTDWVEANNPNKREARFLYRLASVAPLVADLTAKKKRQTNRQTKK